MKKIDNRVLDIELADSYDVFWHRHALKMNVLERVLNTPDESFRLSSFDHNYSSLYINNDIKILLYEADTEPRIAVYNHGVEVDNFVYKKPLVLFQREKEEKDSDYKLLRNKIKSIRESKTKVTVGSEKYADLEKYMTVKTKRFFDAFDAISNM